MRVIIDANVFVSAAIQRGASHRLVQHWLSGRADFDVVMCPELLEEITEVLTTRERLRRWIDIDTARRFVATISATVDLVPDPAEVNDATRDREDDYLIALARAQDVDLIISGDKDLLEWPEQRPPVVPPAKFSIPD